MKVTETNKEKFIHLLSRLVRAIKSESERCAEVCGGVTEKELTAITFVGEKKHVKMSEIAENIDAPMSSMTTMVDRLVEKEMLTREHSSDDRRAINVSLSEQGAAAYKSLVDQKRQVAEKLLSQYNVKDQELFLHHINLLISSLEKK